MQSGAFLPIIRDTSLCELVSDTILMCAGGRCGVSFAGNLFFELSFESFGGGIKGFFECVGGF